MKTKTYTLEMSEVKVNPDHTCYLDKVTTEITATGIRAAKREAMYQIYLAKKYRMTLSTQENGYRRNLSYFSFGDGA